jgi:hypothetical protein
MDEEWTDDNAAVEEILSRYEEARDFLPLISVSTVGEFEDVARDISSRVKAIQAKGNTQPSPSPRNPEPKEKAASVEDAIAAKSWPDYLAAKWEAAGRD